MGLTGPMIHEAVVRARAARLKILENMKAAMPTPRKEISQYAPKVVVITPPQDKIGEIIGPGGKNIRALIAETNTDINVGDDGRVTISGIDKKNVELAVSMIENMTREIKVGEIFEGEVKRITTFGAFVECIPGKDGLVHVSKMGRGFVKDPSEVVKVGEKVKVKVMEIDSMGRINLQMFGPDGAEPQIGAPSSASGGRPGGYRPRPQGSFRRGPPMRGGSSSGGSYNRNDRQPPAPSNDDFLNDILS